MKNPYEHLVIYNFDGIPMMDPGIDQDPGFLGMWVEEDTSFLFFQEKNCPAIRRVMENNAGIVLAGTYEMTGDQWHGSKIEPYFVENLCIAPPWDLTRPDKGSGIREVVLDPGVVFGTGRHQTTEDCLTLIHRLFSKKKIGSVLDIGTGTGLLALGAAALGCERVMACDFNLLAVKTCLNNIRLNRFEDRVLAFQARGEEIIAMDCDLVVANIHYDIMRHLILSPAFLEKEYFILSGLLTSEAGKIKEVLRQMPVQIKEHRCLDGIWNTFLGQRA